ncbi:MAG: VOC family protein [Pseudomonadota bacterium]
MLPIRNFDHVGIRISDPDAAIAFYEKLGFKKVVDSGFANGHPIVMLHPAGININLLGPATAKAGKNVLYDEPEKYPGITHIALMMESSEDTERIVTEAGIEITGRRDFEGVKTIFIRDPDRNVLELVGPGPSVAELIERHVSRDAE